MNIDSFRNERMLFLKELASNPDRDCYELCDTLSIPKVKVMSFLRSYFKSVATFTDRDDAMTKSSYPDIRNDISLGVSTEFGELNDRDVDNLYYVYTKYRKIDPTLYLEADQVRSTKLYSEPPKQVAHDSSGIPQPNLGNNNNIPPQAEQPADPQSKGTDYYNRAPKPQTINDPNQAEFNVDRLNKGYSYDFLYGLSRIGLLRFVLEGLPYPPSGNKVEGFVQFFELNQDELMASPDSLRDRLQKYFGDKTGEQASVAFNSYIRYLKPGEKFGVPKLRGQLRDGYFLGDDPMYARGPQQGSNSPFGQNIPMQFNESSNMWGAGAIPQQQAGPKWQDPFNTFYHAELVLPYGMDARSPDAGRLIHEWEAKKKRKRDEDDVQNDIMRKINQRMAFSMGDVLDRGKQGNGGGSSSVFGPEFLQSMVAMSMLGMVTSGKATMVPFQGEDGKIQMRLEQQPQQLDHQPFVDPNAIGPKDILQLLGGMYEKIAEKSTEAMQARIDGLRDSMGLNGDRKDPLSMVGETIKGLREIIPGFDQQFSGSGGQSNAEMHRLLLERDKFMYDKERSDTLIDHQFEMKKMDKEHEMEAEMEANKTRQTTIKGITNALKSALPSIIQVVMMLISMRNPALAPVAGMMGGGGGGGAGGGGLGDILGNVFKMFGGAGGGGDSDEEGDEDEGDSSSANPFSSLLGGSKGDSDDDEGNDEDQGGFNLGDLVSQVMPSVMGMMQKQQRPPPSYPQATDPEIHSGRRHHKNQMRSYDQGDGVRPTFLDVEVGNSSASTIKPMLDAGETPDNIYENIQTEQKVITTRPNINPELVGQQTMTTVEQTQMIEEDDPNVIKLPRYQDKLMNKPNQPEAGVVIPTPRQSIVNTYVDENGDTEEPDDEEDPYPIYSAEDFDDMPADQLRPAQNEGVASLKSSESYLNSINEQLKKRARKSR